MRIYLILTPSVQGLFSETVALCSIGLLVCYLLGIWVSGNVLDAAFVSFIGRCA
jgi:hypothetical protein